MTFIQDLLEALGHSKDTVMSDMDAQRIRMAEHELTLAIELITKATERLDALEFTKCASVGDDLLELIFANEAEDDQEAA